MPRQRSNLSLTERSRQNQRQSRERKKELVRELKEKLRQYEENEIHASITMQIAAKRVARENDMLLQLLSIKGVPQQEIQEFLASSENRIVLNKPPHQADPILSNTFENTSSRLQTNNERYYRAVEISSFCNSSILRHQLQPHTLDSSIFRESTPTDSTHLDALHEIDCHEAAEIIVNLRGAHHASETWQDLGCCIEKPCRVKNTRVLEIMAMD